METAISSVYSPSENAIYPMDLYSDYVAAGTWPEDGVSITEDDATQFNGGNTPSGKMLGMVGGKLAWVDLPPLTPDEVLAQAEVEKQNRIDAANGYMNSKQWPGKAAIGRLKGDELSQYNLWLDYLDALEAVDTSTAPDIDWPSPPTEQPA